jgi:hypothetical protein
MTDKVARTPKRTFHFVNDTGVNLSLTVDLHKQTGLLRSDSFSPVAIHHDCIQRTTLMLAEEEERWLAATWHECFGRRLRKLPCRLIVEAISQLVRDDWDPDWTPSLYY